MYTYKVDLRNHLKSSWILSIYLAIGVLFPVFMVYEKGSSDLLTFALMGLSMLLIFLLPPLIIHLNYYSINKYDILIYDPINGRITINKNGENHEFTLEDIVKLERFKSHTLAENRTQWLPWDGYNHSIIHLKNGQRFVVTSLLVPNMDLPIPQNKIALKKTWYKLAPKKKV